LAKRCKAYNHHFAEGRRSGQNLAKPNKPSRMQLEPDQKGAGAPEAKRPDDQQAFMFREGSHDAACVTGFAHSSDPFKKNRHPMRHLA
jgi:hypothetical protein